MASFRRTQSPAFHENHHLRPPYQNGAATPKLTKPPKKLATHQWRRSVYRCLTFFALGIVIGFTPFGFTLQNGAGKQLSDDAHHSQDDAVKMINRNVEKLGNDGVKRLSEDVEKSGNGGVEGFDGFTVKTVRFAERINEDLEGKGKKLLIVVTPTYNRAMQGYFLSRLGQVLRLVPPPVLWVVVEENAASFETANILRRTGVMYRHLVCKLNGTVKDRGVHQRNMAMEHIELHRLDGVVYFADDDNVYSLELFERLRDIRRFGTWPVAMLAQSKNKAILEGPVCNGSQVIGWHTNEKSKRLRRFHVDMSGFAFNSTILWDPKRWKRPTRKPIRQLDTVKEGFQETTFIEQVVEDESQMEGIPPGCSKIMNWHLHLEAHNLVYPKGWVLQKNLDAVVPVK